MKSRGKKGKVLVENRKKRTIRDSSREGDGNIGQKEEDDGRKRMGR